MTETMLSVCDGIGGAAEALGPLGIETSMLSEIESWPRTLLAQRHAAREMNAWIADGDRVGVPLWGDFSAIRVRHLIRFGIPLPSVLIGGTPCQAFSVAGLRKSLDDARGNLTLSFVKLANAIDNARSVRGLPPLIVVWENVPGVLSTKDNAFGCFLGALVGDDAPLVPVGKQRWTNAGLAVGPRRKAAWIVKDAQYFRVAQRRRRVFLVASARTGFDPSEVLLEPDCVRRNPPSRGVARQDLAGGAEDRAGGIGEPAGRRIDSGAPGDDLGGRSAAGGDAGADTRGGCDLVGTLTSSGRGVERPGESRGQDPVVAVYVGNAEGGAADLPFLTTSNLGKTVNNQTPLVSVAYSLSPGSGSDGVPSAVETEVAPALTAIGEAERNGRGLHVVEEFAFKPSHFTRDKDGAPSEVYPPLSADADKGDQDPVVLAHSVIPFDTTQITSPSNYSQPAPGDACHPLAAGAHPPAIAFQQNSRDEIRVMGCDGQITGSLCAEPGTRGTTTFLATTIAFTCKDSGQDAAEDLSPTLRSMGFDGSHANGGGQVAVAFPIDQNAMRGESCAKTPSPDAEGRIRLRDPGLGLGGEDDPASTLQASGPGAVAIAFSMRGRDGENCVEPDEDGISAALRAADGGSSKAFVATVEDVPTAFRIEAAVRRLTPTECERLQGYRDGYTAIAWRGRSPEECPDGPRYRALGNSWALPCVKWVGEGIVRESARWGEVALQPGPVWGDQGPFEWRLAA